MNDTMTTTVPAEPASLSTVDLEPVIRPEGIEWTGGVEGRPLLLHLTFENPHDERTRPTPAVLEVAEFGAFRPWHPLRTFVVPPVPPRGRLVLTVSPEGDDDPRRRDAPSRPADLESLARRALGGRAPSDASVLRQALRKLLERREVAEPTRPAPRRRRDGLAAILLAGCALETGGRPMHFVGNFNLKVGQQQPVERHFGDLDDLRAGQVNVTMFKVGDGLADTYTFRVRDVEPGWRVELRAEGRTDLREGASLEIAWTPVYVLVTPPQDASAGIVRVAVHREKMVADALVEFKLRAG